MQVLFLGVEGKEQHYKVQVCGKIQQKGTQLSALT